MLRIVIVVLLGAHGIGHLLFLMPVLGIADWGQTSRSWVLGDGAGARVVGVALWIAVLAGYGAAVVGLWDQRAWWRTAAIAASAVSVVGLVLFWVTPATSPEVSALAFDLLILGALLVAHWPSTSAVGS